jgi:hypothetical protein
MGKVKAKNVAKVRGTAGRGTWAEAKARGNRQVEMIVVMRIKGRKITRVRFRLYLQQAGPPSPSTT